MRGSGRQHLPALPGLSHSPVHSRKSMRVGGTARRLPVLGGHRKSLRGLPRKPEGPGDQHMGQRSAAEVLFDWSRWIPGQRLN